MAINYLKPDKIIDVGFEIKQKLVPDGLRAEKKVSSWINKGDLIKPNATMIPKGVTIHNTPDIKVNPATNPAEQYCRATYNGNMGGAMVHYYVYKDEVWQLLRHDERGWHAGDGSTRRADRKGGLIGGNLDTVAIEVIGDNPATVETAQKVAAYVLAKENLTIDDLYTHQYFSGKYCPAYILPFWDGFKAAVSIKLQKPKPTPKPHLTHFTDLDDSKWYAKAINELADAGIVKGYPDGSVKPEQVCTRAEAMQMIAKAMKLI